MDFKKCARCGCFFTSLDDTCGNCSKKDLADIATLKTYFEEGIDTTKSLQNISINTGISDKNLNRYLQKEEFTEFVKKYLLDNSKELNSTGNISILN